MIEDSHPIRTACFSPNGNFFGVGTNSRSLKLFSLKPLLNCIKKKGNLKNLDEGVRMIFEEKKHHEGSIYCLDWSPTGRLLATGSNDKMIKLMVIPGIETDEEIEDTMELLVTGHNSTVRAVSFNPNNELCLLSAGLVDTDIKVWDTEKAINIANLVGNTKDIYSLKWSNDGQLVASGGADKSVRFWDLKTKKVTNLINALSYDVINDISIFTKSTGVRK